MFAVKCILVDSIWYHFSTGHNNTELINDMCVFGVQSLEGISLQQLIIPVEETFTQFCEKPVFIPCIQLCYKQIGAVQCICILLMITGIEQNPGLTPNSEALPSTVIVAGTFHQGQTDQFSDQSVGRQCVSNSVAVISFLKLKHTTKWTRLHMDNILQEGDALYKEIHSPHDFLEFKKHPTHVKLFTNDFTIHKISDIFGTIHKTVIEKALNDVSPSGTNVDAVLLLGDQKGAYASSMMYVDGRYYIFDTHSQSVTSSLPSEHRPSVLLEFDNLSICANYVTQIADILHTVQFTVWKVTVDHVWVYQIGNKVVHFKMITPHKNMKITDSNYKLNQTGVHMVNTSVELSNTVKHKDKTQENVEICKQSIDSSKVKSQVSDAISHWQRSSQEKTTTNNYVSNTSLIKDSSKQESQQLNVNITHMNYRKETIDTRTQQDNRVPQLVCPFCGQQLDNSHNKWAHTVACKQNPLNHVQRREFMCTVCQKKNLKIYTTRKNIRNMLVHQC